MIAELAHGFLCCDMESYRDQDTGKVKYKLVPNVGRMVGAAITSVVIAPLLTVLY